MVRQCEICGNPVYGALSAVQIDGGTLHVCPSCARLGKPIRQAKDVKAQAAFTPPQAINAPKNMDELELKEDYNKIIKQTRERLGLSQEELGRKINEKPSVIKLLESGTLKPDTMLTKKLEHFLKVQLLAPSDRDI